MGWSDYQMRKLAAIENHVLLRWVRGEINFVELIDDEDEDDELF
jgi:hypothetical protein